MIRSIEQTSTGAFRQVYLHLHWLKTLDIGYKSDPSGETGELFLEDARCDDVPISKIVRKLRFRYVDSAPFAPPQNTDSFFYR
jgi:hypothetical protein